MIKVILLLILIFLVLIAILFLTGLPFSLITKPIEIVFNIFREKRTKYKDALKKYYRVVWEESSSLNPVDVMDFRGYEDQGFHPFYYLRDEDERIKEMTENGQNVLVTGRPLSGKTRAVYQALVSMKNKYNVTIPHLVDINSQDFVIPYDISFSKKQILFLDDIEKFTTKDNFIHLLREFKEENVVIVATCRKGLEYEKLNQFMEEKGYQVFQDIIEMRDVDDDVADEVAKKTGKKKSPTFDHTVGSILLEIETMKTRYKDCSSEEKGVLKSLKRLYLANVYREREIFSVDRIKRIAASFEGLERKEHQWCDITDSLESKDFFRKRENEVQVEETYLEQVFEDIKLSSEDFREMVEIFRGDPEALFLLGDRAIYTGEVDKDKANYMKIAINAFDSALNLWTKEGSSYNYGKTKNGLGIAYWRLSEVEYKIDNLKNAMEAFSNALQVLDNNIFRYEFAATKGNIGLVSIDLSEEVSDLELKKGNLKISINSFEEILDFYKSNNFPRLYAQTQVILGNAYQKLFEVEKKTIFGNTNERLLKGLKTAENLKKAAKAY